MRAKYAALMAAQYARLDKQKEIKILDHYLYRAIFPKIGGAFIRGLTSVTIHSDLIDGAQTALEDLGYAITRREYAKVGQPSVMERVEVTIDWKRSYLPSTPNLSSES